MTLSLFAACITSHDETIRDEQLSIDLRFPNQLTFVAAEEYYEASFMIFSGIVDDNKQV